MRQAFGKVHTFIRVTFLVSIGRRNRIFLTTGRSCGIATNFERSLCARFVGGTSNLFCIGVASNPGKRRTNSTRGSDRRAHLAASLQKLSTRDHAASSFATEN
jgi:hypothetical protein